MEVHQLDAAASASPQIRAEDVAALKQAGFRLIVNNRPDGEAADQPPGREIEAAAKSAGLDYAFIPVGRAPLTQLDIERLRQALDGAEGPALLYCRSGTRSATLWALAEAKAGRDVDEIVARAGDAGYDLSAHRPLLEELAAGSSFAGDGQAG